MININIKMISIKTEITNQDIQKTVYISLLSPQILEIKNILSEIKMLIEILKNTVVEIH